MSEKKFKTIKKVGFLGGVCSGIAYYFEMPTWIIRFIWALCFLIGFGGMIYLLLWWLVPDIGEVPDDYKEVCE